MKKKIPEGEVIATYRGPDGEWTGHPEAIRAMKEAIADQQQRARRWPQKPNGDVDTRLAIAVLASSFPTLRGVQGTDPWDVDLFLNFLCSPLPGSGAQHAARFVLGVWNPGVDWREAARERGIEGMEVRLAPFNVFDAIGSWDNAHRLAFITWCDAPFWP